MAWFKTGGGSGNAEVLYASYKNGMTLNTYTFTQNYKRIIAIGSMMRTSGSGLAAEQRPKATLATGTKEDLYDTGIISSNYRVVVMECDNVQSGDEIYIGTPNTNFYDSLTIIAV